MISYHFLIDFVAMSPTNGYQRKTSRQSWNSADMEKALAAVADKKMGWLRASREFNVPQATLRRRANNKNKVRNVFIFPKKV